MFKLKTGILLAPGTKYCSAHNSLLKMAVSLSLLVHVTNIIPSHVHVHVNQFYSNSVHDSTRLHKARSPFDFVLSAGIYSGLFK